MPIFSLPSNQGIGTLGNSAYKFIDFLKSAGQKVWQLLPLCPADFFNSPYQSDSFFAGNPLFIDLELLKEDGLLKNEDFSNKIFTVNEVDYAAVKPYCEDMLKKAFSRFRYEDFKADFDSFTETNSFWAEDYALFCAIKKNFGGVPWTDFPSPLKSREPAALESAKAAYSEDIAYTLFVQFIFYRQWEKLHAYAAFNGVELFGDMPIYPSHDSADVWAHPEFFMLDKNGALTETAGTPPDAFSPDGQLWGNPVYNYDNMKKGGRPYSLWTDRILHAVKIYDRVRIDHFRGLDEFFAIPAGDKPAANGVWRKAPGSEIFAAAEKEYGATLPVAAEDLGTLTDGVRQLLKTTGFAGMKVLQFGFDGDSQNPYLPYNFTKNCVAYLGTHDNPTIISFKDENPKTAERILQYTGNTGEAFNWAAIRMLEASVADTVILTLPDIMGLGSAGRINTPATTENNWKWRIDGGCLNPWLAGILRDITLLYGR